MRRLIAVLRSPRMVVEAERRVEFEAEVSRGDASSDNCESGNLTRMPSPYIRLSACALLFLALAYFGYSSIRASRLWRQLRYSASGD